MSSPCDFFSVRNMFVRSVFFRSCVPSRSFSVALQERKNYPYYFVNTNILIYTQPATRYLRRGELTAWLTRLGAQDRILATETVQLEYKASWPQYVKRVTSGIDQGMKQIARQRMLDLLAPDQPARQQGVCTGFLPF